MVECTHVAWTCKCHFTLLFEYGKDEDEADGEAWEMSQSGHCPLVSNCPVESIAVSTCPPLTMYSNMQLCSCALSKEHCVYIVQLSTVQLQQGPALLICTDLGKLYNCPVNIVHLPAPDNVHCSLNIA